MPRKTDTWPNNSLARLLTHWLAFRRGTQNQLAPFVLVMGDHVASIQCTSLRLSGWGTGRLPGTCGSLVKKHQCFGRRDTYLATNSPDAYLLMSVMEASASVVPLT